MRELLSSTFAEVGLRIPRDLHTLSCAFIKQTSYPEARQNHHSPCSSNHPKPPRTNIPPPLLLSVSSSAYCPHYPRSLAPHPLQPSSPAIKRTAHLRYSPPPTDNPSPSDPPCGTTSQTPPALRFPVPPAPTTFFHADHITPMTRLSSSSPLVSGSRSAMNWYRSSIDTPRC